MAALEPRAFRTTADMQPLVPTNPQLDDWRASTKPAYSRIKRSRRRLRSLAKGGDGRVASASSAESSTDDGEASRSDRQDRSAARLPNWEVLTGFGVALTAIAVLVYYLFFDSSSSPAGSVTASSATLAGPSGSSQPAIELTSYFSLGVESGLDTSPPATTPSAIRTSTLAAERSAVSSTPAGMKSLDTTSAARVEKTATSGPSPTASSTAVSRGDEKKSDATGETYKGKATFYFQNGNAGACGKKNPDDALICALQTEIYAGGKNCGKKVQITRTSGKGGSITVTVADECPSCEGTGYVDLSAGAYDKLGSRDEGMFDISWQFVS